METLPCNLPETDPLTVASNALEQLAHENGFAIHNVPSDGNCMFSALTYQLQSMGRCVVESIALRNNMVAWKTMFLLTLHSYHSLWPLIMPSH